MQFIRRGGVYAEMTFPRERLSACPHFLCRRRARFKRSNSVTASVQADLGPEGFPGLSIAVPTQDKSLQFGCSFQRHSSEPESASQYTECHRTVHTQGQWAYREVGLLEPPPFLMRAFMENIPSRVFHQAKSDFRLKNEANEVKMTQDEWASKYHCF